MSLFDLFLKGMFVLLGAGFAAWGLFGFRVTGRPYRDRQKSRLRDALGLSEEDLAAAFRPLQHPGYRLARHLWNGALVVMGVVLVMAGVFMDASAGRFPNAVVGGVTMLSIFGLMAGLGLFYLLFRDAFRCEIDISSPKAFKAERVRKAKSSRTALRLGAWADRLSVGLFLLIAMSLMLYNVLPSVLPHLADIPRLFGVTEQKA